jgi:phage-related tail fiber protein
VPDLRGEFLRGWDHGRGVDPGREFGSWQADELKSHTHDYVGVRWEDRIQSGVNTERGGVDLTKTTAATGGSETRPRNIAVMYIIKY